MKPFLVFAGDNYYPQEARTWARAHLRPPRTYTKAPDGLPWYDWAHVIDVRTAGPDDDDGSYDDSYDMKFIQEK